MQFFTLIISALAATALAAPTHPEPTTTSKAAHVTTTTTKAVHTPTTTKDTHPPTDTKPPYPIGGDYDPCKGKILNSIPKCCAVNVLGLVSLDCDTRKCFLSAKSPENDVNLSTTSFGRSHQCDGLPGRLQEDG